MNQGTASASIHCPNKACGAKILTEVALTSGTRFMMKCANCGSMIKIIAGFNSIEKKLIANKREENIVTHTSE